jgi:O-antigen/teichoic acid export membrane protein
VRALISELRKSVGVRFGPGSFARHVAVLTGGTALGQAITVLASPILTRLYTPEDFGVLAVYSSLLGILSVVASLRYELAIPLPENDDDAVTLVALCLGIVLLMSICAGTAFWLLRHDLFTCLKAPALQPYLWLLPLGMFLVGAYQVLHCWALRKQAFAAIARTKLTQGISAVLTQIATGFMHTGPLGLLIGQTLGQGAGFLTLLSRYRQDQKVIATSPSGLSVVARRFQRFPLLSMWPAMINSLALQLPILAFSGLFGAQVTGWFALTNKVFGVPLSVLSTSTASVLLAEAAREHRSGNRLDELFWKVIRQQCFVGAPVLLLIPACPIVFPFIFGPDWKHAGSYASVWIPAMVAHFIASPTGGFLDVLERQDLFFLRELCRLLLLASAVALSLTLSLPALSMLRILSAAMVFFALLYAGLSLYAIKHAYNDR